MESMRNNDAVAMGGHGMCRENYERETISLT